jgi:Tfp pilus assembly protein PilO
MNSSRAYLGACLVAIAGIIFWILLMPMYDQVMLQRDAIAQRGDILQNRNSIIANISALTQQYAQRSSDIARFTSIVPTEKSAPELVSSLQALANNNGLQITTIALSGGVNQDKNPYQEQSIDIGVNGTYPAFKNFLLALENNIRIIDIISFDAAPVGDNSSIISFRIKGNAYYLK